MRRLYAWATGAAGGLAAYRLLRRSRGAAGSPAEAPADADPRVEELRAKLAETREEPAAEPEPEPEDVAARRRSVHEHGRAAIDEMRGE